MANGYDFSRTGQQLEELFDKIDDLKNATQEEDGLMSAEDKAKIDGIEPRSEENVVEGVQRNGVDLPVSEKKVDIAVPVALSELTEDSQHRVVTDAEKTAWNEKYTKPSAGIPRADMSEQVRLALDKAEQSAPQSAVDEINGKIPAQASPSNQLADKNYVDTSVSTASATFRGTSTTGLTEEQFISWANTLTHDLNDYVYWDTTDSSGNSIYRRYKWTGSQWLFEYAISNANFTDEEWAAIRSGVSALEIAQMKADTAAKYTKPIDGIPKSDLAEAVKESLDAADSANERMTASQTKIAWLNPYLWTDEQTWPEKKSNGGGGGGGSSDVLHAMPTFSKRGRPKFDNVVFYVSHPMMDNEGAEIVLMHYAKMAGKKDREEEAHSNFPKKGYCLATGGLAASPYFVFSAETPYEDLVDFCESYEVQPGHYGIALRIPNPDYNGPVTTRKTAVYKGVPESLYSDVLPVQLSYSSEDGTWGIGLK